MGSGFSRPAPGHLSRTVPSRAACRDRSRTSCWSSRCSRSGIRPTPFSSCKLTDAAGQRAVRPAHVVRAARRQGIGVDRVRRTVRSHRTTRGHLDGMAGVCRRLCRLCREQLAARRFSRGFSSTASTSALPKAAEKALVADLAPESRRGVAFGWYTAVQGLGALAASLMFGVIWSTAGAAAAFAVGACSRARCDRAAVRRHSCAAIRVAHLRRSP